MGFGTLFTGYLLLFICRGVDIFPDIAAYVIMFIGLRKLALHSEYFRAAKLSVFGLIGIGLINDVTQITSAITGTDFGIVQNIVSTANGLMLLVFHWLLYTAMIKLTTDLHLPKLTSKARRNLGLTVVYCAVSALTSLRPAFIEPHLKYFALPILVLGLVWIALGASLIYGCYMHICLEGDEEMETENPGLLARMIFRNQAKKQEPSDEKANRTHKKKRKHK